MSPRKRKAAAAARAIPVLCLRKIDDQPTNVAVEVEAQRRRPRTTKAPKGPVQTGTPTPVPIPTNNDITVSNVRSLLSEPTTTATCSNDDVSMESSSGNSSEIEIIDLTSCDDDIPPVTSTVINANEKSYNGITVEELYSIIREEQGFSLSTLLVDCREQNEFQDRNIDCSVNVPSSSITSSGAASFPSKRSIVAFLQEKCTNFIGSLNVPGFYDTIVVLDESSSSRDVSNPVRVMVDLISQWNECTRTNVSILEGGFGGIANYDYFFTAPSSVPLPYPYSSLFRLGGPESRPTRCVPGPTTAQLSDEERAEVMRTLNEHIGDLDCAITVTEKLLDFKRKFKALEAVKLVLLAEQEEVLKKKFEMGIPGDVKCPVCLEPFLGEIYQCANGHCICSACCQQIHFCPECRICYYGPGGIKIRNRVLERLMTTSLRVDCPYSVNGCNEKLAYGAVATHMETCGHVDTGLEMVQMQADIDSTGVEIVTLTRHLEIVTNIIEETEHRWNAVEQKSFHSVPEEFLKIWCAKKFQLFKVKSSLSLEAFVQNGYWKVGN